MLRADSARAFTRTGRHEPARRLGTAWTKVPTSQSCPPPTHDPGEQMPALGLVEPGEPLPASSSPQGP